MLVLATVAAWWLWWPAFTLVAAGTGAYLVSGWGRRRQAFEAERRDRMRVARHWRISRDWPVRWTPYLHQPWAITDTGNRVQRPGGHVLIAGMTGSGKSVAANGLLWQWALNRCMHYVLIDLKGGVSFRPWRPRADLMATSHEDALVTLQAVHAWVEARLADMEANDLDEIGEPSPRWPFVLLAVDEFASLMMPPRHGDKFRQLMRDLVERGRAAGLRIVAAMQSPKATIIPTEIRENFTMAVVGAMRTRTMANLAAGEGMFGPQSDHEWGTDAPWLLDVSEPEYRDSGRFLIIQGASVTRARFVRRGRQELADLAARTAVVAEQPIVVLDDAEVTPLDLDYENEPAGESVDPLDRLSRDELVQILVDMGYPEPAKRLVKEDLRRLIRSRSAA
jgi:hypothetical protein